MCTGASDSNPLKNPLYWLVKQDSRAASQVGRTFNWQYLVDEGKHNQENPGRALTKAGEYAATYYLGGLLGDYLGGSGAAADAASSGELAGQGAQVVGAASPYASQVVSSGLEGGGAMTGSQLNSLAMQEMADTGLLGTGGTSVPESLLQYNQIAPVTDLSTQAPAQVIDKSVGPGPLDWLKAHFGPQDGAKGVAKTMALKMGAGMLTPQQPMQQPMGRPAPMGQPAPMPNPYSQQQPVGMPGQQRVISGLGMTEEQKAALRAQGFIVT